MGDRLRQARIKAGFPTAAAAAEGLGFVIATYQAHENGNRNFKIADANRYATAFKVRLDWLLTGKGDMRGRGVPSSAGANPIADPEMHAVPLIDYVVAGSWRGITTDYARGAGMRMLYTAQPLGKGAFALTVTGRSMEPDFHEGDDIIVDPSIRPRPGDLVVAKRGDDPEATFKRYRPRGLRDGRDTVELTPLNPDYPSIMIDDMSGTIVGVMVEHRRYRR